MCLHLAAAICTDTHCSSSVLQSIICSVWVFLIISLWWWTYQVRLGWKQTGRMLSFILFPPAGEDGSPPIPQMCFPEGCHGDKLPCAGRNASTVRERDGEACWDGVMFMANAFWLTGCQFSRDSSIQGLQGGGSNPQIPPYQCGSVGVM